MAKVPGVTRDLLQKQILELLEGIGIPAKEWIGKAGSKVRRLVTKTELSPFKPDMLSAMSQQKKTFGDALDAFSNEAKFIMNANDQELMNFKNNITDYTSLGGKPGGGGVGSLMKDLETSLKDLETSAKDLKLSSEAAKDLAEQEIKSILETAQHGGDPFKVPDTKSFGGNMYAEGNIRTAVREFMQTELNKGRLKLNKDDTFFVRNYGQTTESDPILVFKKVYGDNSIKKIEEIVNVFEKGESFKHYEQLLRENVDDQFLKPLNKENVGDGTLVLDESYTYKEPLPDDPDIPFNLGGRVGLKWGSKKLFNFTKKQLTDAVNDIFPTGDRKYDAEMVSDALVENNPKMFKNRLRQDLNDSEYSEIYGIALDALDAFNAEARELMKGKKGVGSLIKKVNEEFGEGTAKKASDLPKGTKYETLEAVKDFEAKYPIEKKPKIDFSDPKFKAAMEIAGQKGIAISDASKRMGYDPTNARSSLAFDDAITGGMEGFPAEIREQVIRAKYGDIVDTKLLEQMIGDTDPQHLSMVMGTVDEGMRMYESGMGPDEIVEAIKASMKREPSAAGGGIGSMFKATDRVGLVKGSGFKYAGMKIKDILDKLMKNKKIRNLVEKVNEDLHETGIAKMWHENRTLNDKDKIVAEKVIAPFVETVDKMIPWKGSDKGARNASLAWFRESFSNPKFKEVYHPNWEKGKTVFRGMKHPEDMQYSKDHPSNMFMTKEHAKMFKPENVGAFASTDPGWAIKFASEAKGFPRVTKTHLDPIRFQESVERNLLENPYGHQGDVILDAEKKAALETDIAATGIAAFKKYWPFNEGGTVDKQNLNEDGVGSMFRSV